MAGALLVGLDGCDVPPAEPLPGVIHVRAVTPEGGLIARDGAVRLTLDALLAPQSLAHADAHLASGERELGAGLAFDPVTRVLTFDPVARLLDPDVDYELVVEGPRGFDGAELEPVSIPIRVARGMAPPPEPPPTIAEVEAVLAPCAGCHGPEVAVLGLDVTDLERTAIGVPADEVRGVALGAGLGGTMRIEPGRPDRSYLLYKMLGEGPIVGARMLEAGSDAPLSSEAIAVVSRWIAAGAPRDQP